MRYVTDRHLAELGLDGLEPDNRRNALRDAEVLYDHLDGAGAFELTDGELRKWAERRGIGPDRFNRALRVLEASGRVAGVNIGAQAAQLSSAGSQPE